MGEGHDLTGALQLVRPRSSLPLRVYTTLLCTVPYCILCTALPVLLSSLLPSRTLSAASTLTPSSPMASDLYGSPDDGLELERIAVRADKRRSTK